MIRQVCDETTIRENGEGKARWAVLGASSAVKEKDEKESLVANEKNPTKSDVRASL